MDEFKIIESIEDNLGVLFFFKSEQLDKYNGLKIKTRYKDFNKDEIILNKAQIKEFIDELTSIYNNMV